MNISHVLGIDVGTATIKVLSGEIADTNNVSVEGIGIVPASGWDKGAIFDYAALAASVRQAVECVVPENSFFGKKVLMGIGGIGIQSFTCVGSIAPLSPKVITKEDIDRACRSAVLANIPDNLAVLHVMPQSFKVDNIHKNDPLGQRGNCLEAEIHAVTVPKAAINELLTALKNEGIAVENVVANAIVCAKAIMAGAAKKDGMVIDIGAGTTEIAIFRNGIISYSASIPLGGNYITRDIMQALEISEQHAEGVKRYYSRLDRSLRGQTVTLDCNDYGTKTKHVSYDFLADVIECRVEEIVSLIIEHTQELLKSAATGEVLVTGGTTMMPSFIDAMQKSFGLPVIPVVPQHLSTEYAYPANSACYGILCHAAEIAATCNKKPAEGPLKSLFHRIKQLF